MGILAEYRAKEIARKKEIFASVEEGLYSAEEGAEKLNMSVEDFIEYTTTIGGYKLPNIPTDKNIGVTEYQKILDKQGRIGLIEHIQTESTVVLLARLDDIIEYDFLGREYKKSGGTEPYGMMINRTAFRLIIRELQVRAAYDYQNS